MAVQNPFFGKRDNDAFTSRNTLGSGTGAASTGGSPSGAVMPSSSVSSPASTQRQASPVSQDSPGSKLTVGPNIKLKGVEITDCDTLVVEGTVEATMDSRVIHISEHGAFKGSAEIDIAEIHGEFNGTLTVRQKLVIYSTGKVHGKIRYGKLVVEEGGQLAGEIEAGFSPSSSASSTSSSSTAQRAASPALRAEPAAMAA